MLDSLHLTVTCLTQVVDQKLDKNFYIEKIFELLEMLLLGGNKKIQRSIFNFFDKNPGQAEKFFAKVDEILKTFTWRFGSSYNKKKSKRNDDDVLDQYDVNNDTIVSGRKFGRRMKTSERMRQSQSSDEKENTNKSDMEMVELTRRVLRILQLFCENHYNPLQNYVRDQYNTTTNYNMLESISRLIRMTCMDPVKKLYGVLK